YNPNLKPAYIWQVFFCFFGHHNNRDSDKSLQKNSYKKSKNYQRKRRIVYEKQNILQNTNNFFNGLIIVDTFRCVSVQFRLTQPILNIQQGDDAKWLATTTLTSL